MRLLFFKIFFIFSTTIVIAQELPLNTQVFLNPYYYNPAFAGYESKTSLNLMRRQQWTQIPGAPTTNYFSLHTAFGENKSIPFGIAFVNDTRSILASNSIYLTSGFRANIDENHHLTFALSPGVSFHGIDFSGVIDTAGIANDPAIANALENNTLLEGNFGVNYHNNGLNVGIALPNLFQHKAASEESFSVGEFSPLNHGIFMASYKMEAVKNSLYFEPWVLAHYRDGLPIQIEGIATFYLKDFVWLGGSYRQDYGASAFFGFNISNTFKFGYSYEFNFNSPLSLSTNEFQLALLIGKSEKKKKAAELMERRRAMLQAMRDRQREQQEQQQQQQQSTLYTPTTPTETPTETPPVETTPTETEDDSWKNKDFDDYLTQETTPTTTSDDEVDDAADDQTTNITPEPTTPVTTRNEEGIYIGPTTVKKGNNILELEEGYYVVVGTYPSYREAEEYSDQLFIQGFFTKFGYVSQTGDYYVYIFYSPEDEQECVDTKDRLLTLRTFKEIWVLTVE